MLVTCDCLPITTGGADAVVIGGAGLETLNGDSMDTAQGVRPHHLQGLVQCAVPAIEPSVDPLSVWEYDTSEVASSEVSHMMVIES
jgi:hypothetical protein